LPSTLTPAVADVLFLPGVGPGIHLPLWGAARHGGCIVLGRWGVVVGTTPGKRLAYARFAVWATSGPIVAPEVNCTL
jgi:hypothetical protein